MSEASAGSSPAIGVVKDVIGVVRDAFIIIGVLLYFIGYAYRSTYLQALSVPVDATQSSVNELSVYTFEVAFREIYWLIAFLAIVSGLLVLMQTLAARQKWSELRKRRCMLLLGLIVSILTLPIGNRLANAAAQTDAAELRRGHLSKPSRISFVDTARAKLYAAEPLMVLAAENQNVFIVEQNDKTVFLVVQNVLNGVRAGEAHTFWLAKDAIASVSKSDSCDLVTNADAESRKYACP